MKHILYLGDPNSIHDLKWVSWFSTKPDYRVFFLSENSEYSQLSDDSKVELKKIGVTLLEPIASFSVVKFWRTIRTVHTLRRIIKTHDISLLHVMFATPFAFWIPFISINTIITTRGSDVLSVLPSLLNTKGINRIHDWILFTAMGKAFQNSSAITCTSEGQISKLRALFSLNKKPYLIRTGVNVSEISLLESKILTNLPKGKRIIFLPRYIQPIYRIDMQLEAIKTLPFNIKTKIILVLIEGKNEDSDYKNKVLKLLAELNVEFVIYKSLLQMEMWDIFKQSALAIMTPRTDGTPNTALEAMAAKCPLILGNFSYDETLFGDEYCLRMKTDTIEELAKLVMQALERYSPEMVNKAFENVLLHGNRQNEMLKLEELYKQIINS